MLLHILLNNTKQEIQNALSVDYLHILKMSQKGQAYLHQIKKHVTTRSLQIYPLINILLLI